MAARRPTISPAHLRLEISQRNLARAAQFEHETTCGEVPGVVYQHHEGAHGNFHPASYRAICARPDWRRRLTKCYTGGRHVPRSADRRRFELDCATSSDALLMNIFCYPRLLHRPDLCGLLGIDPGLEPSFGIRARLPLTNGHQDRTEIDMRLGHLLIEAKLTEAHFQTASLELLLRYPDLGEVFSIADLPFSGGKIESYQLVRGALAAHHLQCSFLLLCDERRADLIDRWFRIISTVRHFDLRSRLALVTWQELSRALPPQLQTFLDEKYGIRA